MHSERMRAPQAESHHAATTTRRLRPQRPAALRVRWAARARERLRRNHCRGLGRNGAAFVDRLDRGDDPVSAPTHDRDVPRLAAVVPQRIAHQFHPLGHGLVVDHATGPHLVHELAAGHHVGSATHQRQQQVESQAGKLQYRIAAAHLPRADVDDRCPPCGSRPAPHPSLTWRPMVVASRTLRECFGKSSHDFQAVRWPSGFTVPPSAQQPFQRRLR